VAGARGMTEGVRALAAAHREGRRGVEETVEELIAALGESAGAPVWLHVESPDRLRARARELAGGRRDLPLLGVPFAVKDNIDVAGLTTSAACPDYSYRPERTAFVVDRLLAAGAVLAGKTNMDQFATGLVGTRSPHGACSSAFSADHVSGGIELRLGGGGGARSGRLLARHRHRRLGPGARGVQRDRRAQADARAGEQRRGRTRLPHARLRVDLRR